MNIEVVLPKIGMAMQDALITKWLKQPGDSVGKGEPLLEIETEKVLETIEAPESGILTEIFYQEGQDVEVGAVIAHIQVA
jgi:pyruvate/2-oxoglutarate dehydrogenase complex dihydrolipoamide acyltransferase (E2) component